MRDRVTIGQSWRRRRDGAVFTITQVHRADRAVEAARDGERLLVWFSDLRRKWQLLP